jgi:hypothetical protein
MLKGDGVENMVNGSGKSTRLLAAHAPFQNPSYRAFLTADFPERRFCDISKWHRR